MNLETLIEFGLSEKEAKTYLALLEFQVAGVNEISKKTGINRSSTYVTVESLKKKGLAMVSPDKSIQQIIASPPETLLEMAKERSSKALSIAKKIEKILPKLRSSNKPAKHQPKVVVYEGDEAIRMSYYSVFGDEFRIYKDLTGMAKVVPENYVAKDAARRKKGGIKMFMISPNTPENAKIVADYKKNHSPDQFALIPKNKFSKTKDSKNIGIGIYKDRVKFASTKEKFAIYIINQEITDTLRDLFDLAWEESKRLSK